MSKRKTKGTQEPISRRTNDHAKPLGERVNGRPKETQQDRDITTGITEWYGRRQ